MQVERFTDAQAFLDRAGAFLCEREAEHNLMLGIAAWLVTDPLPDQYLACVAADGNVVAAALRTPPHNLVLSEVDDLAACSLLVEDVASVFDSLRGVLGPTEAVEIFSRRWLEQTGQRRLDVHRRRIYRAERVERPQTVPGAMRPYADADRDLCLEWLEAFVDEAFAGMTPPPEEATGILDDRL